MSCYSNNKFTVGGGGNTLGGGTAEGFRPNDDLDDKENMHPQFLSID